MTPETLQAYRDAAVHAKSRADKATPGPWHWQREGFVTSPYGMLINAKPVPATEVGDEDSAMIVWRESVRDFVLASRADIPTLADAVEKLAAEVDRLQDELVDMKHENKELRDDVESLEWDVMDAEKSADYLRDEIRDLQEELDGKGDA